MSLHLLRLYNQYSTAFLLFAISYIHTYELEGNGGIKKIAQEADDKSFSDVCASWM